MKRNLDTVRKLLALTEEQPAGQPLMIFSGEFETRQSRLLNTLHLMIDADKTDGEAYPDISQQGISTAAYGVSISAKMKTSARKRKMS